MKEKIKELLIAVKDDITKVKELEEYGVSDVVEVGLKEKLYDSLLIVFKPITIDGVTKIYLDAFSSELLDYLNNSCDTQEEASKQARKIYERNQKLFKDGFLYNNSSYEEILDRIRVIPREFKDKIHSVLFDIDYDLINTIKIKDTHARQISGWGHAIENVNDVIFYSELPCIKASIDLFNKNIVTTMNDTDGVIEDGKNIDYTCKIWFDYKSLSDENKNVVEDLINEGKAERFMDGDRETVSIKVPCDREETVGDISKKLTDITSKLKKQDNKFDCQTMEEFWENELARCAVLHPDTYNKFVEKEEPTYDDAIELVKEFGFYYDEKEDLLWTNEKAYKKHLEIIKEISIGQSGK